MESIDLTLINNILKDLRAPDPKLTKFVKKETVSLETNKAVQGGEDIYNRIYVLQHHPNIYLKIEYRTDSYGDNESPYGVEFVRPIEKTITIYEKI